MRRVIAQRMTEVKPGVPHFYLTVDVDMEAAMKIREEAKALESKVSVNDIIVKAVAIALRRYPKVNVSLQGDHILQYETADVGIAVALEEGLITPIIRDADQKGLSAISAESRELAERARKRALKPDEYSGGSITVSNLGMFGIDQFVAVINPPQAAILAVGAVADKAVVRDGQVQVRKTMTATLSCDHRVIDGAVGAEYLRNSRRCSSTRCGCCSSRAPNPLSRRERGGVRVPRALSSASSRSPSPPRACAEPSVASACCSRGVPVGSSSSCSFERPWMPGHGSGRVASACSMCST